MDAIWTFGETLEPARIAEALDELSSRIPGVRWAPTDDGGRFFLGLPVALATACGDTPVDPDEDGLVWAEIRFGPATLAIGSAFVGGDTLASSLLMVGGLVADRLGALGPPEDAEGNPLPVVEATDEDDEDDDYVVARSLLLSDDDSLRLEERWTQRQDFLQALRLELGEEDMQWSADLADGLFRWERSDKKPLIVANTRPLVSWGKRSASVMMGWALESVPSDAKISRVEGLPDKVFEATETDAWELAMRVGDAVGAHFLYRAPSPTGALFLGLWDVRKANPSDKPMKVFPPWPFVARMLESVARLDDKKAASELLFAWGSAFVADTLRKGTPFEVPLREIGEELVALSRAPSASELTRGLRDVRARVAARLT